MSQVTLGRRLTTAQLAILWGVTPRKLLRDRAMGIGCPFIKIGSKVLYAEEDVLAFERANKFASGAEARRAA